MTGSSEAGPAPGELDPDVSTWDAWRPHDVRRLLDGVEAPWYVAAGWAIDLFLGKERREHEDLEIAVPRERFGEVADALRDFELFVVGGPPPRAVPLLNAGELFDTYHQTWVREPATGQWRLDVFREPSDGNTWICRRDERIRLPYEQVIEWTADGIPYGRPEIILLFKAKHADRSKDEADLSDTLPRLAPERRRRLAEMLALAHPGHRWLASL